MKNKPLRHKESNTFKFQPFSERIGNIDIDVFHRVGHINENEDEDNITIFFKTLQKCNDLNLSKSYERLKKNIGHDIQTLPQLLAQKDRLVSVLTECLEEANSLCLQHCLELIVALARDLRNEFYPFYPNILSRILCLLNTKDTDQLEWTFTCLAYLFKYLWKFLVRDLSSVFEQLLPLLSSSKPQYVNNFAAESFAFVARKVKDKRTFLKLILKSLKKTKDGILGCGRLLFEVVNGVQGQFHTCAQVWLPFLLGSLGDQGLPQELLLEVITHTVASIANTIHPKHSKLFWDELQKLLAKLSTEWKSEKTEQNSRNLANMLLLALTALQQKQCVFLSNPVDFIRTLVSVADEDMPAHIVMSLVEISSAILLSPRLTLPQGVTVTLITEIMSACDWNAVKLFVNRMLPYSGFDIHVLPRFLQLCQNQDVNSVFPQLTKIIFAKSPPAKSFNELKEKTIYPLQLSKTWKEKILDHLVNILQTGNETSIAENKENIICSLMVLPHLTLETSTLEREIKESIQILIKNVVDKYLKDEGSISSALFILSQAMSSLYLMSGKSTLDVSFNEEVVDLLLPLLKTHVLSLQVLDLFINIVEESLFDKKLKEIKSAMTENLASPFHLIRLLSANILLHLEGDNSERETYKILSVIISAENCSATITEYRDKLRQLQQLECTEHHEHFHIPLHYLFGNLYVNFKLLWEPVSKLITSYAKNIPSAQFWPVFVRQLTTAAWQVENGVHTRDKHDFQFETLREASAYVASVEDRPDVANQRILVWKMMTEFPEVCEEKNRDLSNLFMDFLKKEYFRINPDESTTWNIKLNEKNENPLKSKTPDSMEVEHQDLDESQESENEDEELPEAELVPTRTASKSLLAHLAVFGRLRNPRSMYREPELSKVYHDLLTHKNPDIQRAALDCIMTYKFKYLVPYKENLYGLIDDKSFKEQVTLFRIDTDNELIRPEHRSELIPVVMRIVYSKMLNRSGVRTGSKSAKQARRMQVFRFLAGCQPEELLFYLRMAFRLYTSTVQDDVLAMITAVEEKLDLGSMVPPKRLMSAVMMLSVVLSQVGSLLSHQALQFLLRVLLCAGVTVSAALRQREIVHPGYVTMLRNIRNTSLNVLSSFFTSFETFPWSSDELNAVFKVFIWPYLEKLPTEGIHSPTSLMKLFMVWSTNARYFPLLIKFNPEDCNVTPLPFMMQLLLNQKSHGSVVNAIMDFIDKLLSWEDVTMDDDTPIVPLPLDDLLFVDKYDIKGEVSFGCRILYPHIPLILERMRVKLSKPKSSVGSRDLNILSHVTGLVHDSATSETLIALLLPVVSRKAAAGEHIICPLITTVTNLIGNVSAPHGYVRNLAPLFGSVVGAEPRRMLSTLVKSIDRKENKLNAKLLEDLNAWNAKWLDQPDFDRRLDAFKTIQQLSSSGQLSIEQGIIVIYTCFHYIRVEKDMSLRDSASQCLRTLCPSLSSQYPAESEYLVNKTILGLIAAGIRDKKSEPVQQESIALLGHMVRECGDLHPVLQDLTPLGNKMDLEVDFFENLLHLQLHRKVRALLKVCEMSKSLTKLPSTRTLTQFVLPIVSHFLYTEKYVNKNTIVDAAIEVLGTVCKMLPWHHYELVLRYYLGKLRHSVEFQKQLVRVIVAILNAFHFDLSNADMKEIKPTKILKENVNLKDNSVPQTEMETSVEDKLEKAAENEEAEEKSAEEDLETLEDALSEEVPMEERPSDQMEVAEEPQPVLERVIVLNKSLATRVVFTIRSILLPQLHRTINARTQSDAMHKVNRKLTGPDRDEEDILRIPIALAAVKLLQRLPEQVLQQNICGILMKMCTFLKSRLDSVRRVTRETLQKVIVSLGPKHLHQLINEMSSILTHGFHVHVLVYSIHSVMVAIKPSLQPGDIDASIPLILQACRMDLFGKSAEEKEVKQIAGNLMEARANRSYDMFHILAEYASQKCLLDLILPLKQELGQTLSHKAVNKGRECLRHIVLGLVDNKFLTIEALLIFAYGTASESIPALFADLKKEQHTEKTEKVLLEEKVDSFIIPKEPKSRPSVQSKVCARTNAHLFVEFGLTLYYFLLKREKIKGADYRPHLDPLVKVLADCLKSEHVKISTLALQCLCWVLKYDLPTLHSNLENITQWVFKLLHKYASAGLSKGDNFDLVMAAFKVVAVLVRDIKYHELSKQQQRTLLLYCEQDIHNYSRQAVAFSLLKAILSRKLQLPELNGVMEKVAKISITADIVHVRLQARQVFHQYLMDYALGKKFDKHLIWYLQQLEYELQPGRESAFEMLKTLVNTLPNNVVKEQSGFMFVTIAARLVNDDVPSCRKMAADIIAQLLDKVSNNTKDSLFDIVLLWLQDKKVLHRRLAVQLCGLFASHDCKSFESRLGTVLPHIVREVKLEVKSVEPVSSQEGEVKSKELQRDHHLYQLLHLLVKLCTLCPTMITDKTYVHTIQSLAECAQTLLAYPHEWVRLASSQFIGQVLSTLSPTEVAEVANCPADRPGYLFHDTRNTLRTLTLDFCSQLTPGVELNDKLLMQTMKNLVFLAEVLQNVKPVDDRNVLTLQWLVRRIKKIIQSEIVQAPNSTILRTMCYNWMAALVVKVDPETLKPLLTIIMAPIVRELNLPESEENSLRKVAKEVGNFVKKKIGTEEYNRLTNTLTVKLQIRRGERKKERAQLVVRDPERAAKRKISNQLKKKVQKKRKIEAAKKGKLKKKKNKNSLEEVF